MLQSVYDWRCQNVAGVLVALIPAVGQELSAATAAYEVAYSVSVPLLRWPPTGPGCHQEYDSL